MISKPWKRPARRMYDGDKIIFGCTTNDRNANITLQYRYRYADDYWHNMMTPSSEYPEGSVLQFGQNFLLKEFRDSTTNLFRCIARAQEKEICLPLGSIVLSCEYSRLSWITLSNEPDKSSLCT